MLLALLLSCLLTSMPVLSSMVVVKLGGVSLSGSRGNPINDNLGFVRLDEGPLADLVRQVHAVVVRPPAAGAWSDAPGTGLLPVWEINDDIPVDLPIPLTYPPR